MTPDAGPLGGVIEQGKAGGQAQSLEFFVTGGDEQTETDRAREALADGRGETRGGGEQHDAGPTGLGLAGHGLLEEIEKYHLIEQAPVRDTAAKSRGRRWRTIQGRPRR